MVIRELGDFLPSGSAIHVVVDTAGCDIVLRPADHYVDNELVSVAQLRAAGLERRETVLGYRIAATSKIVVNPARAHEVQLGPDDEVLVLTRAIARASRQSSDPTTEPHTTATPAQPPADFATTR